MYGYIAASGVSGSPWTAAFQMALSQLRALQERYGKIYVEVSCQRVEHVTPVSVVHRLGWCAP